MTARLPLVDPLVAITPRNATRSGRRQVQETHPLASKLRSLGIRTIPQEQVELFMENKLKEIERKSAETPFNVLLGATIFGCIMALAVGALFSFVTLILCVMTVGIAREAFGANLEALYYVWAVGMGIFTLLGCYACASNKIVEARAKRQMIMATYHRNTRWETTEFGYFVEHHFLGDTVPAEVHFLARRLQAAIPGAELAIHHIEIDPFFSIRLCGERYFVRQWG